MLIFDSFKSKEDAEEFAATQEDAVVCANQEESNKIDVFPYALADGPIVLVPRADLGDCSEEEVEAAKYAERLVIRAADVYGGVFAGT